ncbi:MAG: DUF72 domain-containing protein [Chloroflexota bacterium]
MEQPQIYVGTAGWNVPKPLAGRFPVDGSHLERYSRVFSGVEINSSFYRPHKPATYERWGDAVPDSFRFAVKVPKVITHTRRLKEVDEDLHSFLGECLHLGAKLGPLLIQLPPSLAFNAETVDAFFAALRGQFDGDVACEPRHATWFAPEADVLMADYQVARVAADPSVVEEASMPGGWGGLVYYRLHGSPRIYYSAYLPAYLSDIAQRVEEAAAAGSQVWCIFDNTAEGAAAGDALTVKETMGEQSGRS